MPHNLPGVRRLVASQPWAMLPEYIEAMMDLLQLRAEGVRFSESEITERIAVDHSPMRGNDAKPVSPSSGNIAVLPLHGMIFQRASQVQEVSAPKGTSTEAFGKLFMQAMNDPNVSAIVLDVDSPGGTINGVPELAAKMFAARGTKRVVAVSNGLAASAAYWIASAADEIVVTPSGEVGSIGVYMMHSDMSGYMAKEGVKATFIKAGKYKAEGNPYEPLSEEAAAAIQERVDVAYGMFTGDVAKFRGTSANDVRNGYGEGRVVPAKKAVSLGMADRVATLDEVVGRLSSSKGGPKPGSRRAETVRMRMELDDLSKA